MVEAMGKLDPGVLRIGPTDGAFHVLLTGHSQRHFLACLQRSVAQIMANPQTDERDIEGFYGAGISTLRGKL